MNAILANQSPLPTALQMLAACHPMRRHQVGNYLLDDDAITRFNQVLAQFHHTPIEPDQLASAARELTQPPAQGRQPACIEQRLRRATTIGLMVADPAWQPANDTIGPAELVLEYVRSHRDLIPDELPLIGRLDDAIVIDAAWPLLAGEVQGYLDYCRVRGIEAELRACDVSQFAFSRGDWEQARRAESAWVAHCRESSQRSYLPKASSYFRVC